MLQNSGHCLLTHITDFVTQNHDKVNNGIKHRNGVTLSEIFLVDKIWMSQLRL